jgi:DNA-binding HxlR family transcriptional regulator
LEEKMEMKTQDMIRNLLKDKKYRGILIGLYHGGRSFTQMKESLDMANNATLARKLDYLDSAGLLVRVLERNGTKHYSHYELNSYGKRIAEIVLRIENMLDQQTHDLCNQPSSSKSVAIQ